MSSGPDSIFRRRHSRTLGRARPLLMDLERRHPRRLSQPVEGRELRAQRAIAFIEILPRRREQCSSGGIIRAG